VVRVPHARLLETLMQFESCSNHTGSSPFQIKTVLHATAESPVVDAQNAQPNNGEMTDAV
jgi:hypothetical protein